MFRQRYNACHDYATGSRPFFPPLYAAADAGLFQMQNTCDTGKNSLAL
jgi:hypothetical protein